jgi:hypothetical protein
MCHDEIRVRAPPEGSHFAGALGRTQAVLLLLARAAGAAARCDPMRFSAIAAVVSLVAMAGGCGNVISVPDQGVIILGCHEPSFCYLTNCDCKRGNTGASGSCNNGCNGDPQQCSCRETADVQVGTGDMTIPVPVQCMETAQACVGRGVLCEGANAYCAATGTACNGVGDPPQSIPVAVFGPEEDGGSIPVLERHCQFADDTCCHGATIVDAGVSD